MTLPSALRVVLLGLCAALVSAHAQTSAPGHVDTTFDPDLGPDNSVSCVIVQNSGRVVIAGSFTQVSGVTRPGLARLKSDGSLDASFTVNLQSAQTPGPPAAGAASGVVLLPSDKLLVWGVFDMVNGVSGYTNLAMLSADGQLQTGFVPPPAANPFISPSAVAVQSDGTVLTTRTAQSGTNHLIRLRSNGTVDSSFNATTPAYTLAIAAPGNGPIYVASILRGASDMTVLGLNSDGSPIAAFNVPVFTNNSGDGGVFIYALTVQADGKVLAAGTFTGVNGLPRGGFVRLNANGTVDTSFVPGLDGIGTITGSFGPEAPNAIALQQDGKILLGGQIQSYAGIERNGIVRIDPNGSLDLTFTTGAGTVISNDMFRYGGGVATLALAPGGKILIGGSFNYVNNFPRHRVARLYSPGSVPTRPAIIEQPVSQSVSNGLEAIFSVAASGTEPLRYQWKHNGRDIPGATNRTLTLTNVQFAHVGPYLVSVMNSVGTALSQAALLSVNGVSAPDSLRPTFTITSPRGTLVRVFTNIIAFSGTARDNSGIAATHVQQGANPWVQIPAQTNWSANFMLEPGTNRFRVKVSDIVGNVSVTNTVVVIFVVTSPLTLTANGAGTIVGAMNGQSLEVGKGYTLKATPKPGNLFSNWIVGGIIFTNPTLNFQMTSNLQVYANVVTNPFPALKGAYHGLFQPMADAPSHDNAGFFALNLTDKGAYSGKLLLAGATHPLSGQFDLGLHARKMLSRGTNTPLEMDLQLVAGANVITGGVRNAAWSSDLFGHRPLFNPVPVKFTLLLAGGSDSAPFGQGAATLSVSPVGIVMFKGTLADGTIANQTVPVSTDGQVPLYVNLYGGKGSLFGWVQLAYNDTNDVVGSLLWTKRSGVRGSFYSAGFTNDVNTLGSYYTNRPAGTSLVTLSNAIVRLAEGNLAAPLTNHVVLSALNKILVTPTNTHKLALTLTAATGQFNGSFVNPGTKKLSLIKGVLLQKQEVGGGFFLGTNQSGGVYFGRPEDFPLFAP